MTSARSEPYRVPGRLARRVIRALTRGIRPMVANALVLGTAFVAILAVELALLPGLMGWVDRVGGGVTAAVALSVALFLVPWSVVYLAWRAIWFRVIARRLEARRGGDAETVFTADEAGVRLAEGEAVGHWMAWDAVSQVLLVDDALVFARGTFGLVVPLAALGAEARAGVAALAARWAPRALAASDQGVRDVLAS